MTPNPAVNTDAPPKSRRSAGYLERWAATKSIHPRKEIFPNGHPTNIQHH